MSWAAFGVWRTVAGGRYALRAEVSPCAELNPRLREDDHAVAVTRFCQPTRIALVPTAQPTGAGVGLERIVS
jgi:hypothetical protein